MIEFKEIETVTVSIDNKDMVIYRDEIARNPELYDALTDLEEVNRELISIEFERGKCLHARFSMSAKLQKLVSDYAAQSSGNTTSSEVEETDGGGKND